MSCLLLLCANETFMVCFKQIESLAEVDSLKQLQLTELWLDGNPLCDKYDELTYIKGIKEICPKMEKLVSITNYYIINSKIYFKD